MGLGKLDSRFTGENGVANRLLVKYGGSLQLIYDTGGTYDRTTMTKAGEVSVDETVDCSPPEPYKKSEIDGTSVLKGDLKTIVPSYQVTNEPPVGATVNFDSQVWRIIDTEPIKSGNEVAAYTLQIRRI